MKTGRFPKAVLLVLLLAASGAAPAAEPSPKELVEKWFQEAEKPPVITFPSIEELPPKADLSIATMAPFDAWELRSGLPLCGADTSLALDRARERALKKWQQQCCPRIKAHFQHYVYGFAPPPPGITARVTKEAVVLRGQAKLKEIEIKLGGLPDDAPRIHLALFLPLSAKDKSPVFLALNGWGNHAVVPDDSITHNTKAWVDKPRARGAETDFWCVADVIGRGYAFATFHLSDISPDTPRAGRQSIIAWYPNLATPQTRWAALAAWAWGLSRAVDYLVTDADIDAARIAVIGHSRRGKAALLASAFDERIWLTVPHQSGTGGCALSRGNDQETVEKITSRFPHWFNGVFPQFAGREDRLPVDQHLLIALVAPRLLLDTEGTQDKWANFDSALRALRDARNAWLYHGVSGISDDGVISGDTKFTPKNCREVVQYRLDEKHTLHARYWRAILDFADFQRQQAAPEK